MVERLDSKKSDLDKAESKGPRQNNELSSHHLLEETTSSNRNTAPKAEKQEHLPDTKIVGQKEERKKEFPKEYVKGVCYGEVKQLDPMQSAIEQIIKPSHEGLILDENTIVSKIEKALITGDTDRLNYVLHGKSNNLNSLRSIGLALREDLFEYGVSVRAQFNKNTGEGEVKFSSSNKEHSFVISTDKDILSKFSSEVNWLDIFMPVNTERSVKGISNVLISKFPKSEVVYPPRCSPLPNRNGWELNRSIDKEDLRTILSLETKTPEARW